MFDTQPDSRNERRGLLAALDAMLRAPTQSACAAKPRSGADERRLRAAVRLVDVAASGHVRRGIAWVHGDRVTPASDGLVGEKRTQLEERPRVQRRALGLANSYPVTDAAESSTAIPRPVSLALRTIDLLRT